MRASRSNNTLPDNDARDAEKRGAPESSPGPRPLPFQQTFS